MLTGRTGGMEGNPAADRAWWYDAVRCMFCLGAYPVLDACYSEELVRQVAVDSGPPNRKRFAQELLALVAPC
jgi:hypothetical protein